MIVLGTLFFTLCYFVSLHVFFDMLYVDLESFCWLCCHNDVRLLDIFILINILLWYVLDSSAICESANGA
ncbi:hypothetical protein DFS34DRAFT_600140 [Phlyctochytrium arcticum]|nr:hypothetical protein DFS34DRAFT_600140 [Phlyctochytrium arcticum]